MPVSDQDQGGDPACWAHLFEDEPAPTIVDLTSVEGSGGAVWSLPHGGDLDANLVRLDPDGRIEEHVNSEVDVLIVVQAGEATITIDGSAHSVGPGVAALLPAGVRRRLVAGDSGVTYLSVHRRRGPIDLIRR